MFRRKPAYCLQSRAVATRKPRFDCLLHRPMLRTAWTAKSKISLGNSGCLCYLTVMGQYKSPFALRLISFSVCTCMAASHAAAGIYAMGTEGLLKLSQILQARPAAFTDEPTQIYLGEHPGRDEESRGMWTPELLEAYGRRAALDQVEAGTGNVAIGGHLMLYSSVGTSAGDILPWERSLGSVNTNTGNKLTKLPIVSWRVRGGGNLEFAIAHSSKSTTSTPAGYGCGYGSPHWHGWPGGTRDDGNPFP